MNVTNLAGALFTPSTLKSIVHESASEAHKELTEALRLELNLPQDCSLSKTIDETYKVLRREGNRTDYVYRNAIVDKLVVGKHSLNTTTPIQELRVGSSLADLVVLNGSSTVYEIKSERDTFRRLASQIENYSKVFEQAYVVTSATRLGHLQNHIPEHVGIITLSSSYTLQTVREASTNWELLDPVAISRTMTIREACSALRALGIQVPNVPNMLIRRAIDDKFEKLGARMSSQVFISTLKQSRKPRLNQADITLVPRPLRSFALSYLRDASELRPLLKHLDVASSQSTEGL